MGYDAPDIDEQLMLIKSFHQPTRFYVEWTISDDLLVSMPERWFPSRGREYKGLLEGRKNYISRMIMNGTLLRYSDHICVVQGRIALDFLVEEEKKIEKQDVFVGKLGFYKAKLLYKGAYDSKTFPSTFSPGRPHVITFPKRLAELRELLSGRKD